MVGADIPEWLPSLGSIITTVLGGGLIWAIVALYKVKPEAGQIVVSAAQGALIVQTGVIENLQKEIERIQAEAKAEIEGLRASLKLANLEIERLNLVIKGMQLDQTRHDGEIKSLTSK